MRQLVGRSAALSRVFFSKQRTSISQIVSRRLSVCSTAIRPQSLPNGYVDFAPGGFSSSITEATLVGRPADGPNDEFMTGIDVRILKYAAAQVLSTTEKPNVVFEDQGGFNRLFLLEFPKLGKKLVARVPFKHGRNPCRIDTAVATMSFARYVRGIPAPHVYAWNAGSDNPVGAPYILQEWIEDVVEPWRVWERVSDEERAIIFDDLARCHAALLAPLPAPLHGAGDLAFAPSLPDDADISDPRSYVVRPLHRRIWRPLSAPESPAATFQTSSTSLPVVWGEMLAQRHNLALPHNSGEIDCRELALREDNAPCDVQSFSTVARDARAFVSAALSRLHYSSPDYSASCLVWSDYAFRNILLDPATHRVKAFIDWDDVYVMPFVLGLTLPQEFTEFSTKGLDADSTYFRDGKFGDLPPDEHGDIVGPFDEHGESTYYDASGNSMNDLAERDERIRNTMYRESYVGALQRYEERAAHEAFWQLRKDMIKAEVLVAYGASAWWNRRSWLASQTERLRGA